MAALAVMLSALSALALGAHLLRAGHLVPAAVVALWPLLLLLKRRWAVRATQALLAAGAAEWLRTLAVLVQGRQAQGLPFLRLMLILGLVAAIAALAALLLDRLLPPAPTA